MNVHAKHRSKKTTIVFTGGGTAGHILPGIAVAEQILSMDPAAKIAWIGSSKELERRLIADACNRSIEYHTVRAKPIYKRLRQASVATIQNTVGLFQAIRLLRRLRPDQVVATGGYVCLPTAIAARILRIPLVVIEPNLIVGRANRLLARRASAVCLGHESTTRQLPSSCNCHVTGVPVRSTIEKYAAARQSETFELQRTKHLVIVGGSSGDRWINTHVPQAINELAAAGQLADWKITHQAGERDYTSVTEIYAQTSSSTTTAEVAAYFDDLPERLAGSDLVISRAGASTLAELAVMAIPTVLIPFARAADDHQRRAARILADAGAAIMIDTQECQSETAAATLVKAIGPLLENEKHRTKLAERLRTFGNPLAAEDIARRIIGEIE